MWAGNSPTCCARCSTNNKGEAPSTSNRYTSSTCRSAIPSWINSKAKSPDTTVSWCGSQVPHPPSSPCISNGTYKKNPGLPSLPQKHEFETLHTSRSNRTRLTGRPDVHQTRNCARRVERKPQGLGRLRSGGATDHGSL